MDIRTVRADGFTVVSWIAAVLGVDMKTFFIVTRVLLLTAAVIMTCAGVAQSQPVRVSNNRHYLEFRDKLILPIGDSVTQGWMECGADFDQRSYLDALAARGINVVLLWSYIGTSAEAQRADERIGYDAPELWPWKGSPDDRTFDLTRFNPAYFQRLREFIQYAESKNVIVIITVQDGWTKTRFAHHPFNAKLGNGPLTERQQFVELADYDEEIPGVYDPLWSRQQKNQYFQERFADALCSELKDCSNVIFEMFNEGEWYDKDQRCRHEAHFLRFFRKRTKALLMTNTDHIRNAGFTPRKDPAVDILSFHKNPWTGHYATFVKEFRTEPVRVIFESEPVPSFGVPQPTIGDEVTPGVLLAAVWERTLSGSGWVAQDDTSFGWASKCGMAKYAEHRDAAYDLIGHAASFFNGCGVRFWEMAPHGELSSTGLCLAQPGVEYIVYARTGSTPTVDLSATKGKTLKVRWYDPSQGQFRPAERIDGGNSSQQFIPPFQGDGVLHLKSVAEDATAESSPLPTPLGSRFFERSGDPGSATNVATEVPRWGLFETELVNERKYSNPFQDVTLTASFASPSGKSVDFFGYYDGDGRGGQTGNVWKLRFMPDETGTWSYICRFSDGTPGKRGEFTCVDHGAKPGPLRADGRWLKFASGERFYPRSYYFSEAFCGKSPHWEKTIDLLFGSKCKYNFCCTTFWQGLHQQQ